MITLLKRAIELKLLSALDVQLAIRLSTAENSLLLLIFSLLSAKTRTGHVCLFIDKLQPASLFDGKHAEMAVSLWKMAGSPDSNRLYSELKQCDAICASQEATKPLVLSGNKLYFQRMWTDEGSVADFFSRNLLKKVDEQRLSIILNGFFTPSKTEDWQKIAVAAAVTSRISVISGGPGTGKTTTVARLIATLVRLSNRKLIFKLAAPTGKSARKLTESLHDALLKLNLSTKEYAVIPEQAHTLHWLLGAQLNSQLLRYNKENTLSLDVLIVDEASMINLSMMARLIEALPGHARVIFLGDKNQLSSVESGAVLGDLCHFSEYGYSCKRAAQLTKITGFDLSNFKSDNGPKIKDRIFLLRKSYRFDAQSEIGRLATAINQGNIRHVEQLLSQKRKEISFHSINTSAKYRKLLFDAADCYRCYLDMIKADLVDHKEILNIFNRYRLLASLRTGPYGVVELNDKLERLLYLQGSIRQIAPRWNKNYEGRPIMITRNDSSLRLFNGDIGIILRDGPHGLKAFFQFPDEVKIIQLSRLPQHETAFVITVHKAQGSEFEHIAFCLPPIFTPIISKELIYTAITRARKQLTIYADRHVFNNAIVRSTERLSGLPERLLAMTVKDA